MSIPTTGPRQPRPEAVLISGGFGTRLQPLTTRRPKHLLEVGGAPFVEHQLRKLAAAGIEHVVLATSYHADQFFPLLGDGARFGLRLTYVTEEVPLGTGGAIRNVVEHLNPDPDTAVVILNGDILSGHDLGAQLADFERPRGDRSVQVSLHLVEVPDARAFGCVSTDATGRVTAFVEKSEDPPTRQINAGCYIFRRAVMEEIPAGREVSVERETFPDLLERDVVVVGYVDSAYWRDVGTPAAVVDASRELVLGIAPNAAVEVSLSSQAALISRTAQIADSATVADGSFIADGVRVAAGAAVTASVLMPGSSVGESAVLDRCIVGPDAQVAAGVTLQDVTIGDGAVVAEDLEVGARFPLQAR